MGDIKKDVLQLREKLNKQKAQVSKFYDYYKGEHEILHRESKTSRRDIPEVHNFCRLFIDNNTGFLLGNNIQMKYNLIDEVKYDDTIDEVQNLTDVYADMLSYKIQQVDQKLLRDIQIFGYAYEVDYINSNGEFGVQIKNPMEVAVNRIGNKVISAILFQGMRDDEELYDYFDVLDNKIYRVAVEEKSVRLDNTQAQNPRINPLNNPIVVVYNNWEKQSEMEGIMTLNDAYNQVSADATNEISDFRNAYLHFNGAKITEEILQQMNRTGIISTPENAKVEFVTKSLNAEFIDKKLVQLEKRIYDTAGQVNFNDNGVRSNTSSLALRNKLTNLINQLKLKEGFIKEALNIRLKNLTDYLSSIKVGLSEEFIETYLNPQRVDITIVMNIPTSDRETATMIRELYGSGLLSKETAVSQLSFVNVVRDELAKIDREQQLDGINPEDFLLALSDKEHMINNIEEE